MDRLLNPRSIAVIGASDDPAKIGGRPIAYLVRYGFEGAVYPINPQHARIQGLEAYARLEDVPGPVDLAVIALPAVAVQDAVADCGRLGVAYAIVFTSGFSESGPAGAELQEALRRVAAACGVRLVGPNSLGIISEPARLAATFSTVLDRPSGLVPGEAAFVSQSGAFGSLFYAISKDEGVGFRHFVSVGNESDLRIDDFVSWFADDPETRVIGCYVEGLRDVSGFRAAARKALEHRKPLAVIKVGKSETGRQAARSHTGAIGGSDEAYDGLFRQEGILRFAEMQGLLDFLSLARDARFPASNRVGVLSISGGIGVWLADRCFELGLVLPPLHSTTRERLSEVLPSFATAENPVDFTGQIVNRPELLAMAVTHMLQDPGIDSLIVVMGLLERSGERIACDLARALESTGKLVVVTWISGPSAAYELLRSNSVPVFKDVARGIQALASMVEYGAVLQRPSTKDGEAILMPQAARGGSFHWGGTEYDTKRTLASCGIQIPRGGLATTLQEAMEIARDTGYPVALKVQSTLCLHKTDYGLLELNVRSPEQLQVTYERLVLRFAGTFAPQVPQGVLVEEMVDDPLEVIVGCKHDLSLGPVVMVGIGGIHVEIYRDVAFRLAPITSSEARNMLEQLRGRRLFEGYRGRPPSDLAALAQAISRISILFSKSADILVELELNPLAVLPKGKGVCALDALAVAR